MVDIEEKIKSVKGLRKTLRRLIDEKLNPLLHGYNQNDKSKVLGVKSKLNEKLSILQKVNNEVMRLIEDEDAYENYQNKADDFEIEIEQAFINIELIVLKLETLPAIHPFIRQVVPSPTPHQNHSIKLPQIDIKKFSGDVTEWQTFFDSFEVAVQQTLQHRKNELFIKLLDRRSFKNCTRFKIVRTKLFSDNRNVTKAIWG